METANPQLESFGESRKACVTNSNRPPMNLKGKGNTDLPSVCSNYQFVYHLVLSTFRQCRSTIPQRSAKPIASIHHTVRYPQRNPQFNVIAHYRVDIISPYPPYWDRVKVSLHSSIIIFLPFGQNVRLPSRMSSPRFCTGRAASRRRYCAVLAVTIVFDRKFRRSTEEVYMSCKFLHLAVGSRDLSQAEKKISVVTS